MQSSPLVSILPEIQLSILTYLRAFDLSSLQKSCRFFNNRNLINAVIRHAASHVYPPELTDGFDTPVVGGEVNSSNGSKDLTYESMRNMEMLVIMRALSRPEPPLHERNSDTFYVSKSWCKTALKWLEHQLEQNQQPPPPSPNNNSSKKKKPKKLTKKQKRLISRRLSDISPPWPNVNDDLTCPHSNLRHCNSKSARARRRIMDKQAWKVLRKLYPDSTQLRSIQTECLECALEMETTKKIAADAKEKELTERKKPLSCPLVRGFYTRGSKGVPPHRLTETTTKAGSSVVGCCPLLPGVYHAIPRAWCHGWRKYVRGGEGAAPHAPDASALLCDAHRLPVVPPHLEAFLYGESPTLLKGGTGVVGGGDAAATMGMVDITTGVASLPTTPSASRTLFDGGTNNNDNVHGLDRDFGVDDDTLFEMGVISRDELDAQRTAMQSFFEQKAQIEPRPESRITRRNTDVTSHVMNPTSPMTPSERERNHDLDKENRVVVEILTDEEFAALEEWWPRSSQSSFVMTFAITEWGEGRKAWGRDETGLDVELTWSTPPCQMCDAGHPGASYVFRNRSRKWLKSCK